MPILDIPIFDKVKEKIKEKIEEAIDKQSPPPVIKITMMGPRAVGKTSLMASIFSETVESVAATEVSFVPIGDNSAELTSKKLNLKHIFTTRKDTSEAPKTGAIPANKTASLFKFKMGANGIHAKAILEIKDFPGEYLISDPEQINKNVQESSVIMVAIDSPYLMEEGGKYNSERNKVDLVVSFFENNIDNIKDKLVLLVPVKCERYYHDDRIEDLTDAVATTYKKIIDICHNNNCACVITPIQTLGGVKLDRLIDNPDPLTNHEITKVAKYLFVDEGAKYRPMYCVQPLYYALTYVAALYNLSKSESKSKDFLGLFTGMWQSFLSSLKDDDKFLMEVAKMSDHILYDQCGYRIVSDNSILKIGI